MCLTELFPHTKYTTITISLLNDINVSSHLYSSFYYEYNSFSPEVRLKIVPVISKDISNKEKFVTKMLVTLNIFLNVSKPFGKQIMQKHLLLWKC